jgi:hypothetical protein
MLGKIARLPDAIREQLNQRILNGQPGKTLVAWLNSLPETKAVLKEHFGGARITQQNLSQHKANPYRCWLDRQEALDFATTLDAEDADLQKVLPAHLAEKLSRWLSLRYAATARALATSHAGSPKSLRDLRDFSLFVMALRRGELSAARLALQQQRLTHDLSQTAEAKEKEFWAWTQRPDIREKLYPFHNPDKERRRVVQLLDEHMLGIKPSPEGPDESECPAMLI